MDSSDKKKPDQAARKKGQARLWFGRILTGLVLLVLLGVIVASRLELTLKDLLPTSGVKTRRAESQPRPEPAVSEPVPTLNLVPLVRSMEPINERAKKFDAARDDWDTEILHDQTNKQLKSIAKLIGGKYPIDVEHASPFVTDDFRCSSLGAADLPGMQDVFDDGRLRVRRMPPSRTLTVQHHGPGGFVTALKALVSGLGDGEDVQVETKEYRIEKHEETFSTQVLFSASGRGREAGIQHNGVWFAKWAYPSAESSDQPRLRSLRLERYEQVHTRVDRGKLFADCTESAMASNPSYHEQILPGLDHWLVRISRAMGVRYLGHNGAAVGDVNGDDLEDLYVCDTAGLTNRLYLQNADGTLTDASTESNVDWLEESASALLIDLDNDGDQDLAVASDPRVLVSENNGDGRFKLREALPGSITASTMIAADYDQDGDLDLYICNYFPERPTSPIPIPLPYHDARNGGPNILYRNDGDFRFTDVTNQIGLGANNTRYTLSAAWDDYDNDGDLDLYVANDFGRNNLYRNDVSVGGGFTDVAPEAGVEDVATGMSVSWGDYNRDGLMDIYIGNMFSSAGNRIAFQDRFAPGRSRQTQDFLRRTARGNTLYSNMGDGTFRDVSVQANVTVGRWAWSSKFVDLNNDGNQDLVVANGFITTEDTGDL